MKIIPCLVIEELDVYWRVRMNFKLRQMSLQQFIKRGKVPFYVTYNDLNKVFDTAASHAGRSLGDTADIMAVPISIIARNPKDVTQYYREIINTVDPNTVKPVYVPITSVDQSATSAITKITGSYFYQGVVSAINNPTDQAEVLDLVLRT